MSAIAQGRESRAGRTIRNAAKFKREQVERVLRGEITAAELSRALSAWTPIPGPTPASFARTRRSWPSFIRRVLAMAAT